jgi:hypothetical protein
MAALGPGAGSGAIAAGGARERYGAVVVDKNRASGKRLARLLVSGGYVVKTFEEESPQSLLATIAAEPDITSWLLVGETAAAATLGAVLSRPEARRHCRGVIYGSDELDVATQCEQAGLVALLGTRPAASGGRDFETELLGVANYLRGQPLLPLQGFLIWGAPAYSTNITNIASRDAAEGRIVKLCSEQLNLGSRLANSIGEVVHELITNAMYDAPVDASGHAIYAHDRTAPIQLTAEDRVIFRYGTDGLRLAVETADRFGRLRRSDLVRSLRRAASGQVNRAPGGAGIGLSMICRTAQSVQFDVEPGSRSRVTAVFELESSRSPEGGRQGRSLIFPDLTMAAGRRDV